MVIATKSSSVSPRPRRASAPITPASLLLHKRLMAGERQETDGPTLEQCLVLPPGLALKGDGLLSQSLSNLGDGPERENGVGGGGGGGGGGGDGGGGGGGGDGSHGLDPVASNGRESGILQVERAGKGFHAGDERAIISTYTFEVRVRNLAVFHIRTDFLSS